MLSAETLHIQHSNMRKRVDSCLRERYVTDQNILIDTFLIYIMPVVKENFEFE